MKSPNHVRAREARKRATGRTTRMLEAAQKAAAAGRAVYIVLGDRRHGQEDIAQNPAIKFEQRLFPEFDVVRERSLGMHPNCVVFIDHAIARREHLRIAGEIEELQQRINEKVELQRHWNGIAERYDLPEESPKTPPVGDSFQEEGTPLEEIPAQTHVLVYPDGNRGRVVVSGILLQALHQITHDREGKYGPSPVSIWHETSWKRGNRIGVGPVFNKANSGNATYRSIGTIDIGSHQVKLYSTGNFFEEGMLRAIGEDDV